MSWLLEAIEQAALQRARQQLSSNDIQVCGLAVPQIMALRHYFHEKTGYSPDGFSPEQILQKLIGER